MVGLAVDKYYPQTLVVLQFLNMGLMVLFSREFLYDGVAIAIFILGFAIGIWALMHNTLGNFNIQPKLKKDAQLITTGIYAYIRHPMYTSVVTMMLGILISTPTWYEAIFFTLLLFTLYLKAKREEKLLLQAFIQYSAYKKNTKYLVPFIL